MKNNKLVCPFCNLDIRSHRIYLDGCDNTRSTLWQELIRTRKALEIAVDALTRIIHDDTIIHGSTMMQVSQNALEQITALEQKD